MNHEKLLAAIRAVADEMRGLLDQLPQPRAIGGGIGAAVRLNEREGAKVSINKIVKLAEKAIRDEERYSK